MSTNLHDFGSNTLLDRLRSGKIAVAMSVRLISNVEISQMIESSGFDGFYVDLEHTALDLHTVGQICVSALGVGIPALVRVPANDGVFISRVLDSGAVGVHIPHVETLQDALQAVSFAKFPPLGKRSVSPMLPQLKYKTWPLADACEKLNNSTLIVAVIESQKGLDNIEEIASAEGLDVLLIGTNDLCADWNLHGQFDHPFVEQAYLKAYAACKRYGKHLGIGGLAARPDLIKKYVEVGGRYVMAGSDLQFFMKEASERVQNIKCFVKS